MEDTKNDSLQWSGEDGSKKPYLIQEAQMVVIFGDRAEMQEWRTVASYTTAEERDARMPEWAKTFPDKDYRAAYYQLPLVFM